jgi:hypothetical protein
MRGTEVSLNAIRTLCQSLLTDIKKSTVKLFHGFNGWESINTDHIVDNELRDDQLYWFVDEGSNLGLQNMAENYFRHIHDKLYYTNGNLNVPAVKQYLREHKNLQNLIMVMIVSFFYTCFELNFKYILAHFFGFASTINRIAVTDPSKHSVSVTFIYHY